MAATIALPLVGCGKKDEAKSTAVALAPSAFVASARGRIDIEGGVIRLAAQREGVIEKVFVEEGDSVTAGQVLAVLGAEQARRAAALARAEATQAQRTLAPIEARLAAARREENRLAPLALDNTVPRQELDMARDQLHVLSAELEAVRAAVAVAAGRVSVADYEIELRTVRAPLAGKIVRRQARPGDGVSLATVTPLFLFAPDAPRIVRAELEERWLAAVKPGQAAEVMLEAAESRRFKAHVLRLGQVVGNRTPSDDPSEKQDNRVVEVVLLLDSADLLIGQRVIVRFARRI